MFQLIQDLAPFVVCLYAFAAEATHRLATTFTQQMLTNLVKAVTNLVKAARAKLRAPKWRSPVVGFSDHNQPAPALTPAEVLKLTLASAVRLSVMNGGTCLTGDLQRRACT